MLQQERNGLTAAAGPPLVPPRSWFEMEEPEEPTGWTVTADGQVFGHAALWGTCHTGKPGRCVTPPKSQSDYSFYKTGLTEVDDGELIPTGRITLGTGHASLTASPAATAEHYDNTGSVVADVNVRDGKHGIWVSGALRPDVPPERIRTLRGASLSGDWRSIRGALEMLGLLAVNVPGFPVPRAMTASGEEDEVLALVAAGTWEQQELTRETLAEQPVVPEPTDEEWEDAIGSLTAAADRSKKYLKQRAKVKQVMREFKAGKLKSGSGGKVTSRKQAIAIALSEARRVSASATPEQLAEIAELAAAAFDESKHPRHGKGDPKGGQFAPKHTTESGYYRDPADLPDDPAALRKALAEAEKSLEGAKKLKLPLGKRQSLVDQIKAKLETYVDSQQPDVERVRRMKASGELTAAAKKDRKLEDDDGWQIRDEGDGWCLLEDPDTGNVQLVSEVGELTPDQDEDELIGSDEEELYAAGSFDEAKHPRHKKGEKDGGKFAPKGAGESAQPEQTPKQAKTASERSRAYYDHFDENGKPIGAWADLPENEELDAATRQSGSSKYVKKTFGELPVGAVYRDVHGGLELKMGQTSATNKRRTPMHVPENYAVYVPRSMRADGAPEPCEECGEPVDPMSLPAARSVEVRTPEGGAILAASFTEQQRAKLVKKGKAMKDGSFPIRNRSDLRNAIQSVGRASDPEEARRWIIKRARALKAVHELPASWDVEAMTAAGPFEESKHPRHPKGSREGGRFAPLRAAIRDLEAEANYTRDEARITPPPEQEAVRQHEAELRREVSEKRNQLDALEATDIKIKPVAGMSNVANVSANGQPIGSIKSEGASHTAIIGGRKKGAGRTPVSIGTFPTAQEAVDALLLEKHGLTAAGTFDETKHPRHGKGDPHGGQFAPKGQGHTSLGGRMIEGPGGKMMSRTEAGVLEDKAAGRHVAPPPPGQAARAKHWASFTDKQLNDSLQYGRTKESDRVLIREELARRRADSAIQTERPGGPPPPPREITDALVKNVANSLHSGTEPNAIMAQKRIPPEQWPEIYKKARQQMIKDGRLRIETDRYNV